MATIRIIAGTDRESAEPARDLPTLDLAELGERILDTVAGTTRLPLPNAAAIVLAYDALRAVATSHSLDPACLWIGSEPRDEI